VAAAGGSAMWSSGGGYGDFVLIRHHETDDEGRNYFTLYSHLASIEEGITPRTDRFADDYENWSPVSSGQKIGTAGATGVKDRDGTPRPDWIHLHFEVQRGAYAQNKVDPYDINRTRSYYPGGNNYTESGPDSLWRCDPLEAIKDLRDLATDETVRVARTGGLGLRLRAAPNLSADILEVMPEGSELTIIGGPQNSGGYDWWQVSYGDQDGWAAGAYLVNSQSMESPAKPTGIGQFLTDGTSIPAGGKIQENRIVLTGHASHPQGDPVKLQVEVRPGGQAFSRSTHEGNLSSSGTDASVAVTALPDGNYHWRARTVTADGMTSDWVPFSTEAADFTINTPSKPSAFFKQDPVHPIPGETVTFNASHSTPQQEIDTYKWEFEGESSARFGKEITHAFPSVGDYVVTLTITTKDGLSDIYQRAVRVVSLQAMDSVDKLVGKSAQLMEQILETAEMVAKEADFFTGGVELTGLKTVTDIFLEAAVPDEVGLVTSELFKITKNIMVGGMHETPDYFQRSFTPLLRKEIENYKMELGNLKNALLTSWPDLSPEQEGKLISDLNYRRSGNFGLAEFYNQKTNLPLIFAQLKREDESSWSWWGAKVTFTVGSICGKAAAAKYVAGKYAGTSIAKYLVPKGIKYGLIGHSIYASFDSLSKDGQLAVISMTAALDASAIAKDIFENARNGLNKVKNNVVPETPNGKFEIKQIVEEKKRFLRNSYYNRAYAEAAIHNTADIDVEFWLTAFYKEDQTVAKLLSLPWGLGERSYQIGVISSVAEINLPGNSSAYPPVIIDFLNENGGAIPTGHTAYNLFAKTDDGIYLLDHQSSPPWYKRSSEKSDSVQAMQIHDFEDDLEEVLAPQFFQYPIRAALDPENIAGEVTGNYRLTISVHNPFDSSVMAQLVQKLPAGMELISAGEGLVQEGNIFWDVRLQPLASAVFEVLLRPVDLQDEPRIEPALLALYDNINDEWQSLTALPGDIAPAFNDPNLIEAVSVILGKPSAEITFVDLARITDLDLSGKGILSLGGLEYAYNLQTLDLRGNSLTSVFPLRNISGLENLNVSANHLADLSGLEDLLALEYLDLSDNRITNVSTLLTNSQAGGLGSGHFVDLRDNFLDLTQGSQTMADIQTLIASGLTVYYDHIKGDVNLNGMIDRADAVILLRYAGGQIELTDLQKKIGNIAGHADDDHVGVADAMLILRVLGGGE
jgi:PKD repeat protein